VKKFTILIIVLSISVGGCGRKAKDMAEEIEFDLKDYLWKKRVVIISPNSRDNPSYKAFRKDWDSKNVETKERDMILVEIFESSECFTLDNPVSKKSLRKLTDQFEFGKRPFEIILIGKDGNIKLRSSKSSSEDLFSLIDSMPMRHREIQESKQK
jgi:hypothetical protein